MGYKRPFNYLHYLYLKKGIVEFDYENSKDLPSSLPNKLKKQLATTSKLHKYICKNGTYLMGKKEYRYDKSFENWCKFKTSIINKTVTDSEQSFIRKRTSWADQIISLIKIGYTLYSATEIAKALSCAKPCFAVLKGFGKKAKYKIYKGFYFKTPNYGNPLPKHREITFINQRNKIFIEWSINNIFFTKKEAIIFKKNRRI